MPGKRYIRAVGMASEARQRSVAAGMDNPNVPRYYEHGYEVSVRYIRRVVECADKNGIAYSVCGEMASDLRWIGPLIDANVTFFSVSPYLILLIKDRVRKS